MRLADAFGGCVWRMRLADAFGGCVWRMQTKNKKYYARPRASAYPSSASSSAHNGGLGVLTPIYFICIIYTMKINDLLELVLGTAVFLISLVASVMVSNKFTHLITPRGGRRTGHINFLLIVVHLSMIVAFVIGIRSLFYKYLKNKEILNAIFCLTGPIIGLSSLYMSDTLKVWVGASPPLRKQTPPLRCRADARGGCICCIKPMQQIQKTQIQVPPYPEMGVWGLAPKGVWGLAPKACPPPRITANVFSFKAI
jgi:hypothetical protein